MVEMPQIMADAVESFARLPGVGPKTALRYVLALLRQGDASLEQWAQQISNLKNLRRCKKCNTLADEELCAVCANPQRAAAQLICVVEDVTDYLALERSGKYQGLYYVLGGVINPLLGIGPEQLHLDLLVQRIAEAAIKDVILAINPSVEGDATCAYLRQILPSTVNVDRIGFGMPMGGHLEHLDALTISQALENRKRLSQGRVL
ncbi:MAG: recombination protein RecR [Bacteriovoracaceae bacterium]|nr:recombination protein RecR [Bacteriovoracaceae bacterium]